MNGLLFCPPVFFEIKFVKCTTYYISFFQKKTFFYVTGPCKPKLKIMKVQVEKKSYSLYMYAYSLYHDTTKVN